MTQKNFTIHDNRCFQMRLPNGLVISMSLGAGSYTDNHWSHDFDARHVETDTAEIAVWHDDGKPRDSKNARWITKQFFPNADDGECSVVGYVTMEEFSAAFVTMMAWQPPIIDADQHQRDQGTGHGYAFRFSLRDER